MARPSQLGRLAQPHFWKLLRESPQAFRLRLEFSGGPGGLELMPGPSELSCDVLLKEAERDGLTVLHQRIVDAPADPI